MSSAPSQSDMSDSVLPWLLDMATPPATGTPVPGSAILSIPSGRTDLSSPPYWSPSTIPQSPLPWWNLPLSVTSAWFPPARSVLAMLSRRGPAKCIVSQMYIAYIVLNR